MSVWLASFELSQERLIFLLIGGLLTISFGRKLERISDFEGSMQWVPALGGIQSPTARLGLWVLIMWLVLTPIATVVIRRRIWKDNQVPPKK